MTALALLLLLTAWCAYTDVRHGRIGNGPCLSGLAAGLALAWRAGGYRAATGPDLLGSLVCVAIGFFLFWACYRSGALGAGDVKLMAATGALCASPFFFLHVLMFTGMAGAILALFICWRHGRLWQGLGSGLAATVRFRYDQAPSQSSTSPDVEKPHTPIPRLEGKVHNPPSPHQSPPEPAETDIDTSNINIGSYTSKDTTRPRIPYAAAILAGILFTLGYYGWRHMPNPFF